MSLSTVNYREVVLNVMDAISLKVPLASRDANNKAAQQKWLDDVADHYPNLMGKFTPYIPTSWSDGWFAPVEDGGIKHRWTLLYSRFKAAPADTFPEINFKRSEQTLPDGRDAIVYSVSASFRLEVKAGQLTMDDVWAPEVYHKPSPAAAAASYAAAASHEPSPAAASAAHAASEPAAEPAASAEAPQCI